MIYLLQLKEKDFGLMTHCVVRASSEGEARGIAEEHRYGEDKGSWINSSLSICEELVVDGKSAMILSKEAD